MAERAYLAIDLGASSGRHVAGVFNGRRLRLAETYRFENGPTPVGGRVCWDLLGQWNHVRAGLRAAAVAYPALVSIGVDTWGVDFGLLDRNDELVGNPVHYRDPRTDGILERAFRVVSREAIFEQTGLQFMPFNTLYQLWAMLLAGSPQLESAERLLMMPDLFHWLLTGEKVSEQTNATTTQFYNPRSCDWARELFAAFGLPDRILGPLAPPGTTLGRLRGSVGEDIGLRDARVVLPGTHDTASAVAAVPAVGHVGDAPDWCYISSGTWSLMGAEVSRPVINDKCLALNFTNEGGVGGTTRLLKNIAGLWLVQECRRVWNLAGKNLSWDDLNRAARAARPLASLVDPDDRGFLAPTNMPLAICNYCQRTGQEVPANEGAVMRAAFESLALRYRQVLAWLEELVGRRIEIIHIVGGGSQNRLLCQATADACGRVVVAGPVEATAIGNLAVQAIAAGDVDSIQQAREVVRESFAVEHYEPGDRSGWDDAFDRFVKLLNR
jgi:rhamnulokinase